MFTFLCHRKQVKAGVQLACLCVLTLFAGCGNGAESRAFTNPETTSSGLCLVDLSRPGAADCCNQCTNLGACDDAPAVSDCVDRCMKTQWMVDHEVTCLALRMAWIDEEGCSRLVPTWNNFDDDDDCTGPPPDLQEDE